MAQRTVLLELDSPDPTKAINAFLWNMSKARSLGFMPSTEHIMAEHFFRGDVRIVFYSSSGGVISLCADDDALDSDDSFEAVKFIMERVAARRKGRREEAAEQIKLSAETAELEGVRE